MYYDRELDYQAGMRDAHAGIPRASTQLGYRQGYDKGLSESLRGGGSMSVDDEQMAELKHGPDCTPADLTEPDDEGIRDCLKCGLWERAEPAGERDPLTELDAMLKGEPFVFDPSTLAAASHYLQNMEVGVAAVCSECGGDANVCEHEASTTECLDGAADAEDLAVAVAACEALYRHLYRTLTSS